MINQSKALAVLTAEYGRGNVKITRGGDIHIKGDIPNTNAHGWYLWGYLESKYAQYRLETLADENLPEFTFN